MYIRDALPEEQSAVREITLGAYEQYSTIMEPEAWAHLRAAIVAGLELGGPQHIVAEHDGRIAGSILLCPPGVNAYDIAGANASAWPEIRLLAVPPESRGLGVAKALVDECVRRSREMGANAIGLHTSQSMRAAIGLYTKMGFVRAPERDFIVEGAELIEGYCLRLTRSSGEPDQA